MSKPKSFRTKTGYCHILDDRLVLTRTGTVGKLADVVVGKNSIYRILLTWAATSVLSAYMAYNYYQAGNQPLFTLFFIMAAYLLISIVASLNNSNSPVVLKDSIISVELNKGLPGFTRARFIVTYKDEKGRKLKRLILLKGSIKKNKGEIEEAEEMMRSANYLK